MNEDVDVKIVAFFQHIFSKKNPNFGISNSNSFFVIIMIISMTNFDQRPEELSQEKNSDKSVDK